jgi:putative phosphoribosyl transferase
MALCFRDRLHAGEELGKRLLPFKSEGPAVLCLPRGGVPVGFACARRLDAEMDLIMVRKLPIPHNPEAGFGAVTLDGSVFLNEDLVKIIRITPREIDAIVASVLEEVRRRNKIFRGDREFPEVRDRCAVVVDDGLASGFTMLAAVRWLRQRTPQKIVAAVPVSPVGSLELVRKYVDEAVCLVAEEEHPFAVAGFYEDFHDLTDREVKELLEEGRSFGSAAGASSRSSDGMA